MSTKQASAPEDIETDILVVGAGVTGLTFAGLLAAAGVRAFTIAKHSGTAPAPRAHVTNQRTMEVFRAMGIEERVRGVSTPLPELGNGIICTSLTGMEIARYSCYGAGSRQLTDFATASPVEMVNSPQHVLERVLLAHALENGADIRYNNELIDIQQTDEGVIGRVRQRQTGAEYTVRARYAVGADGGRSLVADQAGIKFQGEQGLINMLTSWLEVDVTQYTAYRPACIYMMVQPGNAFWVGSGTLVAVKPYTEWLLNRQYNAGEEPDVSDDAIVAYARKALGIPDLKITVKNSSKWQVNNVYATKLSHGRIFLAGDSAHRHPPASGLGSNTCVQDAYNLAWKLGLVVSGKADARMLQSYSQERQPVAEQIVKHAIQTLYNFARVPQALGFKQGQSTEEGYKSLEDLFSDSLQAEQRRADLKEAMELQHRRSNALGLQLGHRYEHSDAIVYDGSPFPPYRRDPVLHYQPTTHPGAYLPHAWIEHKAKRISTLDILGFGQFGLLVGIGGDLFLEAAKTVSQELGVGLPVYKLGYRCPYDDVLGEWDDIREIGDRGALLIRPDRHIAWRTFDRPEEPTQALRSAFRQVLGL
ncbi:2,4-dichlorophenol 6-monooxygenase [Aspergillus pseudoustus]|uniref:2,4-dichlorophenol 6-monooxygenase n=1 Tax=Aspergillus pseudoustus TaxID=1810923 RepID=A0ABR4JZN6_9EURO